MVIDKLIVHDFGIYKGCQEVILTPPSETKPIVLFGGLNGAGKTTLIDALQLCLFGQAAKCSNRNGIAYQNYLARCINKDAMPREAMVGLDFRHTLNDKETSYKLRRNWKMSGKTMKENFRVIVDDKPATTITDNWLNHIEEIIPANIAHLFFFDGEQAEQYADTENSSALIKSAIMNLLGLDLVERLSSDLRSLERKTKFSKLDNSKQNKVEAIDKAIGELRSELDTACQEQAHIQTHSLGRKKKQLSEIGELFRKVGGDLYERRTEIEGKLNAASEELAASDDLLRTAAETALPLSLVRELLNSLAERDASERKFDESKKTLEILKTLNDKIIRRLELNQVDKKSVSLIVEAFKAEICSAQKSIGGVIENPLEENTRLLLRRLLTKEIDNALANAELLLNKHNEIKMTADGATREWASVPQTADIKEIIDNREKLGMECEELKSKSDLLAARISGIKKTIAQLENDQQAIMQAEAELKIKSDESERVIVHSTKARDTLAEFSKQLVYKHINKIQELVLECYQNLLRKKSLLSKVMIDPKSFDVSLYDNESRNIHPDRLSAGERQLLAISMVWGLAKASGRPLPTAIDTPLGRLDSLHRRYLVGKYFPNAGHQVMLFSTDEELTGQYLGEIENSIGRRYLLEYDDKNSCSMITEGYLQ